MVVVSAMYHGYLNCTENDVHHIKTNQEKPNNKYMIKTDESEVKINNKIISRRNKSVKIIYNELNLNIALPFLTQINYV